MAAGDLIVRDYQAEFDEVLFGYSNVEVTSLSLWDGLRLRTSDVDRPLDDGQFAGDDYYSGRRIVIGLEIWGDSDAELGINTRNMLKATARKNENIELVIRLAGWDEDLIVFARPRRRQGFNITQETVNGHKTEGVIEFWSTDPRIYSKTLNSASTSLAAATQNGLTFDINGDWFFGGPNSDGALNATNDGDFSVFPTLTITGPVLNPSIEHVESGQILTLLADIPSGTEITIDTRERTILDGLSSRYFWLDDPSQWFSFQPGVNTLRFRGSSLGTPTLTAEWRSAWV